MTITFSFCFILTSLALIGRNQERLDSIYVNNHVQTEQIGEHFVSYLGSLGEADAPESFDAFLTVETIDIDRAKFSLSENKNTEENICELTVKSGGTDGTVVLYIKANLTDGQILSWRHTAPEITES